MDIEADDKLVGRIEVELKVSWPQAVHRGDHPMVGPLDCWALLKRRGMGFDKADQVPKTVAPSDCFVSLYLFWAMEVGNCMIDVRDASCFRQRTSGHCALGKWDSATKVQHSRY